MRCLQSPESFLSNGENLPDECCGIGDIPKSPGCGRSESYRRKRGLYHIRCAQMHPVLFWKLIKRHHPVPIVFEYFGCLGIICSKEFLESISQTFTLGPGFGIRNPAKMFPGLGLNCLRESVQHIDDLMVPAPLLSGLGIDLAQSTPDPQMTVCNKKARRTKPPALERT